MRVYNNISFPIKVKKKNTDSQNINIFTYRSVFFTGEINIDSLNIDATSSASFLEETPFNIEGITVESGKMLLIDKDTRITGDISIQNGGEVRII